MSTYICMHMDCMQSTHQMSVDTLILALPRYTDASLLSALRSDESNHMGGRLLSPSTTTRHTRTRDTKRGHERIIQHRIQYNRPMQYRERAVCIVLHLLHEAIHTRAGFTMIAGGYNRMRIVGAGVS